MMKQSNVNSFKLVTEDSLLYKNSKESVSFRCVIDGSDYVSVKNVMKWIKIQEGKEVIVAENVAIFEDLQAPFKKTGRFNATTKQQTIPTAKFEGLLTINNLKLEDSGIYRCTVSTFGVNHTLSIADQITSLSIYGSSKSSDNLELASNNQLLFESNVAGKIRCVAESGFPAPIIYVYENGVQRTSFFHDKGTYCNLTGNTPGLQTMNCVSWIGSQAYTPVSDINSKVFKCMAHVHDNVSNRIASVTLFIKGIPTIIEKDCPNVVLARKGDRNLELVCLVMAQPAPNRVSWRVDSSGEEVTADNGNARFTAVNLHKGNGTIEVKLVIREVTQGDFHTYTLSVANIKGEMHQRKIDLKLGPRTGAVSRASGTSLSLILILLSFAGCVFSTTLQ